MDRIRILSTRTLPQAEKSFLPDAGFNLCEKDFIRITPVDNQETNRKLLEALNSPDAFIFTSANAVEITAAFAEKNVLLPRGRQIFTLNGRTFKTAEVLFPGNNIIAGGNNGKELADTIIGTGESGLCFFCSHIRRNELPSLLTQNNILLKEISVYNTEPVHHHLEESFDAVLFFSPSAVQSFFHDNSIAKKTVCFAIGNTTALAAKQFTNNEVVVSEEPDVLYLLNLLVEYFKNYSAINYDHAQK